MKKQNATQTDYAYLAGYIDGDGCFHVGQYFSTSRSKFRFNSTIAITSTNRNTLRSFKNYFNGSVCTIKEEHDNCKTLYQYCLQNEHAANLTSKILAFLVEKQEEAKLFIKFIKSKRLKDRAKYINQMKILKDITNLISKHHKKEFEQFKNTIVATKNDFAYLAGFIDAECCLSIQKYKPKDKPNFVYKILLRCNDTKAPVFKWLIQRFGGTISFIDRRNHKKARKNQLLWRLSGKALSKILPNIYPFLKNKKPVCEELIKFYNTTLKNGGARHTKEFRTSYAKIIKIRERIVQNVHKLNLKGIQNT